MNNTPINGYNVSAVKDNINVDVITFVTLEEAQKIALNFRKKYSKDCYIIIEDFFNNIVKIL